MELRPTTTRGKAQRRYPLTSMIHANAARKKKHIPPLNSVQLGVQIRFTIGQMPVKWSTSASAASHTPVKMNFISGTREGDSRYHRPAKRPSSMVPRVGMKLSVRYPPSLYANGASLGKRFRNQRSNAWPRLLFLFQCEANPV